MSRKALPHAVSQFSENETVFYDTLLAVGISMVHVLTGLAE
jgi:hypothetical protein